MDALERVVIPRIPTGWLIGNHNNGASPALLCQRLGALGCNLLNVHHGLITAEFAFEIRRRGIALWCWTVDDLNRMREMETFGVQGITSNYRNASLWFSFAYLFASPERDRDVRENWIGQQRC